MGEVFAIMIQHVITAVIVAFVVGVAYILQNKIEDLETELAVLNKMETELNTQCVQVKAKVEFMETSLKESLKESLDTIAVYTKRKEEQGKLIHQQVLRSSNQQPLYLISHYPMSRPYQNLVKFGPVVQETFLIMTKN